MLLLRYVSVFLYQNKHKKIILQKQSKQNQNKPQFLHETNNMSNFSAMHKQSVNFNWNIKYGMCVIRCFTKWYQIDWLMD